MGIESPRFGKGKSFTPPLSPSCLFQAKSLQSYYPQGTQPFLTEDLYFLTLATFACAWSWYGLGKVVKTPKTNSQNPKIGGLGRCFSFIRFQPLVFRGCSKYLYFPWTERSGDTNKNFQGLEDVFFTGYGFLSGTTFFLAYKARWTHPGRKLSQWWDTFKSAQSWSNVGSKSLPAPLKSDTPLKSNVDTQNSHVWKEIHFPNPSIFLVSFLDFKGILSYKLTRWTFNNEGSKERWDGIGMNMMELGLTAKSD